MHLNLPAILSKQMKWFCVIQVWLEKDLNKYSPKGCLILYLNQTKNPKWCVDIENYFLFASTVVGCIFHPTHLFKPPSDLTVPKRIYNPITAMGFSAMFTFQLDNTKR